MSRASTYESNRTDGSQALANSRMAASGRLDPAGTLSGNDRYLREADDWSR